MSPEEVESTYRVQAAFTGTAAQTGDDIAICQRALGFVSVKTEDGEIPKSRANFLKGMKTDLFDYQVSGLAHVLGNVFGDIPVENIDKDLLDLEALEHIQRFALQASWVCDLPGIGKTLVYLAFLLWVAKHAKPETNKERKPFYRPGLLALPPSMIPQNLWDHL